MSILFLRVDEANINSTADEISHALTSMQKSSLLALFAALKRLRIYPPRDVRRLITLKLMDPPKATILDCNPMEYYKFYFAHPTTQKYNPFICGYATGTPLPGLYLSVISDNERQCLTKYRPINIGAPQCTLNIETILLRQDDVVDMPSQNASKIKTYDTKIPINGDVLFGVMQESGHPHYIYNTNDPDQTLLYKFNHNPTNPTVHGFQMDDFIDNPAEGYLSRCTYMHIQGIRWLSSPLNLASNHRTINHCRLRVTVPAEVTKIKLVYGLLSARESDMLKEILFDDSFHYNYSLYCSKDTKAMSSYYRCDVKYRDHSDVYASDKN